MPPDHPAPALRETPAQPGAQGEGGGVSHRESAAADSSPGPWWAVLGWSRNRSQGLAVPSPLPGNEATSGSQSPIERRKERGGGPWVTVPQPQGAVEKVGRGRSHNCCVH